MSAGRQAEEHHAEVILDQLARRVETLEAALREIDEVATKLHETCGGCRVAQELARKALEVDG